LYKNGQKKQGIEDVNITGSDPFTYLAYKECIGKEAETFTFEDIGEGKLSARKYDIIICCYALHLVENSWLFSVCEEMSHIAKHLIVITPHKRPIITPATGWEIHSEILEDKVRMRLYNSFNYWDNNDNADDDDDDAQFFQFM
jgi:hypothetical protein